MATQPDTILLHCNEMAEVAKSVAERAPAVQLGNVVWRRFEDDFPNLLIEEVEQIRGHHVAFLACFDSPDTILEQLSVIHELPRYGAGSMTIILPYFPTATMERVNREGEVATAKSLARLLSVTPLSMNGPARLVVYDIHALQERFYFTDDVIPQLETAIPLIQERLEAAKDEGEIAIAFPDEGAWKRFGSQLDQWPQIMCHKVRQGDKRVVTLKEGEPAGKHVIIIDDLVKTGGTLLECQALLSSLGARAVSAYVTHPVFPQESWQRFTSERFEKFWTTDSCPTVAAKLVNREPFEVLSLGGRIAALLGQPHLR